MYDGTVSRATFQHMVLMSLAGDLLKAIATDRPVVIISERSPWGARTPLSNRKHAHYIPSTRSSVSVCRQLSRLRQGERRLHTPIIARKLQDTSRIPPTHPPSVL